MARTIIASMQANRVRRLLTTSMLGVGESKENAPLFVRLLVATFLRGAKSAMEFAVESSGLDWTILCPAVLTDDAPTGDIRVFQKGTGEKAHKISRADVAAFMVNQLSSSTYLHQAVTIANK